MKKVSRKPNIVAEAVLDYLEETDNKYLLPQVTSQLEQLLSDTKNIKKIIVTSPIELTSPQKSILQKYIQKKLNLSLPLINKIDKKLLGGFTIQVGDWFLDASLRYTLSNLKNLLLT